MFCEWLNNNDLSGVPLDRPVLPPYDDDFWKNAPDSYITDARQYLGYEWLPITADMWLDFSRNGNRSRMEERHFKRRTALCKLVAGELKEQKGEFLDDIINGLFAICEESFWGVSAHLESPQLLPDAENPTIDLFSAQTAGNLAVACYLLGDKMNTRAANISKRVRLELNKRIKRPFESRDFWWTGNGGHSVNNWNPWIISNILTVYLLAADTSAERIAGVKKCLTLEDNYMRTCLTDGGCDEGVGYWCVATGCVFDTLEQLWFASGGVINFFHNPLIKKMGGFAVDTHIHGNLFLNFADGKNHPEMWGSLLYRFGQFTNNAELTALGSVTYNNDKRHSYMLRRELMQMTRTPAERAPKHKDSVCYDKLQLTVTRRDGWVLAVKGGHNAENHNHNDVGSFSVFLNDEPLLIDIGVGEYTAKTFSPQRYELKPMQSGWHNLPDVNGCMQHDGREYRAGNFDFDGQSTTVGFSDAYPSTANLTSLSRRMYIKDGCIYLSDLFSFKNDKNTVCENFIFRDKPNIDNGKITIGGCVLEFLNEYKTEIDCLNTSDDIPLKQAWERDRLWRVRVTAETDNTELELKFIIKKECI